MAVGNVTDADQVNAILAAGRADLVALGRPHLAIRSGRCTRPRTWATTARLGRFNTCPAKNSSND